MLSPKLHEFYNTHIDAVQSLLSSDLKLPRFVRLNPRYEQEETLSMLTAEMQHAPKQITWLDSSLGFFAVGGEFKLAQSASFRSGRVYGMDVSSGAAVAALLSDRYDKKKFESRDAESEDFRVLDLCCCPGLKCARLPQPLRRPTPAAGFRPAPAEFPAAIRAWTIAEGEWTAAAAA